MELVEKVKSLHKSGMSFRNIAVELGISSTRANNIYHGRMRKYRNEPTTEDKVRKLREKGLLIKEIAKKLKLDRGTVSGYVAKTGIVVKRKTRVQSAIELNTKGLTVPQIASKMGLKKETVYNYLCNAGEKVNRSIKATGENKALCKCLYMDGYSFAQIVEITNLATGTVKSYIKGVKPPVIIKPKTIKVMKKKKVKATPTQIEQRDVLGKGVESGVYSTEVKLREDRDDGRIVTVRYKDYGGSIKTIDIRVRDNATDNEAGERWCKKFGKEYVC
jgi:orotate phosphoribosyltransferase-like protein